MDSSTTKMRRININTEQKEILKQLYCEGMVSAKNTVAVKEACARTHLPIATVKTWIRNHRKELAGKRRGQKSTKQCVSRNLGGFHMFCKEFKSDIDFTDMSAYNKERREAWQALTEGERAGFRAQAELLKSAPAAKLSDKEKGMRRNKLLKDLQVVVDGFGDLGHEMVAVVMDQNFAPSVVGTERAHTYTVENRSFMEDLRAHLTSKIESLSQEQLRCRVQALFNKLYDAGRGRRQSLPYKAVADGQVAVIITGMPANMTLRDPKHYLVHELRVILEAADNIRFSVREISAAASTLSQAPQATSSPANTAPTTSSSRAPTISSSRAPTISSSRAPSTSSSSASTASSSRAPTISSSRAPSTSSSRAPSTSSSPTTSSTTGAAVEATDVTPAHSRNEETAYDLFAAMQQAPDKTDLMEFETETIIDMKKKRKPHEEERKDSKAKKQLVGKQVIQIWNVEGESKLFHGAVTKVSAKVITVSFEDGDVTLPWKEWREFLKNSTLKILQ